MKAITDSEGKIAIVLQKGDDTLSFKIAGMDDEMFAPETEVEIPDERLNTTITNLAAPFGLGPEDRVCP